MSQFRVVHKRNPTFPLCKGGVVKCERFIANRNFPTDYRIEKIFDTRWYI